ncbi:homing endonuclease associated repeat-containing protein [Candidatus Enterococcus ferrettii]|uniref:Uncharacterized protein n=1 Tax=Candidatus Enterococcus ferrettii TaxID=2815324 RepID=A0ABV0EKA3_9ENTE|nr:hypothetical protein [Enterococcus sp. 665A]MBO1341388.1 hypothetical protein [Enterococcus sp. 665A]
MVTNFKRKPNNEELIALIQEEAAKLGRPFFVKASLVAGRFGNWGNFLSAAKLEPSEPRWYNIPVTDEELIELVQKKAADMVDGMNL